MKLSLFKISILLIIIGASVTIIVFSESEKLEQFMILEQAESDKISLYFEAGDIGYHKVTIPEFDGQGYFYRIVDDNYDTKKGDYIQTKMSIRYFDVKESGTYTMILSNTAKENMNYQVEIGSTNIMNISIPTGVMFVGGLLLLFTSYIKLKNYRIEQPDENIK
jgi:hypothetical protein